MRRALPWSHLGDTNLCTRIALAVALACTAATAAAQSPSSSFPRGNSQQPCPSPALAAVLEKCSKKPAPCRIGADGDNSTNIAPPPPALPTPAAIPGVIAANQSWKVVWAWEGNNADGPIAGADGKILFANQDASNVMELDPATGLAKVIHDNTNTGGALSRSKNGALFLASRGVGASATTSGGPTRAGWKSSGFMAGDAAPACGSHVMAAAGDAGVAAVRGSFCTGGAASSGSA